MAKCTLFGGTRAEVALQPEVLIRKLKYGKLVAVSHLPLLSFFLIHYCLFLVTSAVVALSHVT